MIRQKHIPLILIGFRLCLAAVIPGLALFLGDNSRPVILALIYLGLFSDIFDGIIARRAGVATARLRRLDSQTDLVFWLSVGISTWILFPAVISANYIPIAAIFIMEGLCYLTSIIKFGRETCTHAFLSKLWGITLLIAFTSLIGFGIAGIPFMLAIVAGLLSQVDVILIILILPEWTHDIPSFYHAWLIRKGKTIKRHKLLN